MILFFFILESNCCSLLILYHSEKNILNIVSHSVSP